MKRHIITIGFFSFLIGVTITTVIFCSDEYINVLLALVAALLLVLMALGLMWMVFSGRIIKYFANQLVSAQSSLSSPLKNAIQSYKDDGTTEVVFSHVHDLIGNAAAVYQGIHLRKWIISACIGLFAILGALLSFSGIHQQNELIKSQTKSTSEAEIAQVQLELKDDYLEWRRTVPALFKKVSYDSLLSIDTSSYYSRLNYYWAAIVRQEYEVAGPNGSEKMNGLFDDIYGPLHTHSHKNYTGLEVARKVYVCSHLKELNSETTPSDFYNYVFKLDSFDLDWKCDSLKMEGKLPNLDDD